MRPLLILVSSAYLCGTVSALGQTDSALVNTNASLTIQASIDGAPVFVDGVPRGTTPLTLDSIDAGRHVVRIVHPEVQRWLAASVLDTIVVVSGEHRTLRYDLTGWLYVSSQPSGASVFLNDSLAGTTPLLLRPSALQSVQALSLRRDGFAPELIGAEQFPQGSLLVALTPTGPAGAGRPFNGTAELLPEPPSNTPLYVTGGAAVGLGVVAAYCKAEADNLTEQYVRSGDKTLLQSRDRYDTTAALTIAAMQLSVALFVYFLLTR